VTSPIVRGRVDTVALSVFGGEAGPLTRGGTVYFRLTGDTVELVDPADMTAFHVTCPAGLGREDIAVRARAAGLGELSDDDHLMVPVDAIRRYAGDRVDAAWEKDLAGMLDYARGKGWLSEDGSRVRAHVTRSGDAE
jgi:hypothetical protein